ncbi:MAG: DNA polymerase III subunit gamma/tau [Syntrophaceae bacterium]|nr:DNA polymerase III subunit gamma/tau [Syntrophaceae bacterium]
MEYLVLARKWRPQIFEDVVGQDHVVKTLRNAVRLNRISHAYIFSGPRGTGKTSVARILAKSINCAEGPTETPCNRCANCSEITAGSSLDVREIDGASNNGVEEIRELRENIKFSPVSSRYKIYIIDEVHMLSKAAFNALLKTLEEPPSHVVFIFATTEIPKVPATILSRCQRFDFKRISVRQIAENLGHIAREEEIAVSDTALSWIAREGQGSLRDAQSIFDQVISYAGKEIKDTDVEELLDLGDRRLVSDLAGAVIARDAGACLKIIDEAYYSGADVDHFYRLLLEYFMNLLTAKVTDGKGLLADLPDHEVADLQKLAEGASQDTIQRLLDILMAEEYDIRKSPEPRINLEYAVVKMAYLEPLVPIDEILARMEGLEQRLGGGVRETDSPAQRPAEGRPVSESSSPMRYRQGDAGDPWQALKGFIKEKNPPLSSKIDNGTFISYENGRLRVGFPKGYLFLDVIRSETQQNLLQRMAEEFFGEGTTLEVATLEDEPRTSGAAASNGARRTNDIKNEALRDPLVQKVMDVFPGAEIVDVRVNGSRRQ